MSPEAAPILAVNGLVKRFGGFHALDGLSFHVSPGEILGLVGPNGSGKTTAINVISGLYAPDGGALTYDGASIGGMASHRIVHRGINRTFQIPKPFTRARVYVAPPIYVPADADENTLAAKRDELQQTLDHLNRLSAEFSQKSVK